MKLIAESAFNHQGDFEYLLQLAQAVKEAGADYFTVQVLQVDSFCVKEYKKYNLYKDNEFSREEWIRLFDYCKEIGIEVIPCVLDEASFHICNDYGFSLLKLHATDLTNKPLLDLIVNESEARILLETQCATLFEINFAIEILGLDRIEALFSGYSNYPTEVEDLNLDCLDSLRKEFGLEMGYADHSTDIVGIPVMLLAKGCKYLEKHITLSRNHRNFDWQVSLYPEQFKSLVANIEYYSKALGNGVKHPVANEVVYRGVMYKKVVDNDKTLKRADSGLTYVEHEIASFEAERTIVALIARLKSFRLKEKVLKPLAGRPMILGLYDRCQRANRVNKVVLATSTLPEDQRLADLGQDTGLNVFQGHPGSVIDRMLNLAFQEKAAAIFRVTGDNPFTPPELLDAMVELMQEHSLDYVKVNNVPFGVSPELFSTNYLWKLYLKMENPMVSEYATWFVLNDAEVRKGAIDVQSNYKNIDLVNLSIDYQHDYDQAKELIEDSDLGELVSLSLAQILSAANKFDRVNPDKEIKLPKGDSINLRHYLERFKNENYIVRKNFEVK